MLIQYPVSGGGSITVGSTVGSASNSQMLYVDGSGNLAQSSSLTFDGTTLKTPAGTYDPASGIPGLAIGNATTGLVYESVGSGALDFHVQGRYMATFYRPDGSTSELVTNVTRVRPDSATSSTLGTSTAPWAAAYTKKLLFGGITGGVGYPSPGRDTFLAWVQDGAVGFGVNVSDATHYGSEFYLKGYDNTAAAYNEFLNFTHDNRTTTMSAPAATSTTQGQHLILKGADAASGKGGDLLLNGGASSGSTQGCVYLPNTNGAPGFTPASHSGYSAVFADPTNNKLWMYNGSAWKSVALT